MSELCDQLAGPSAAASRGELVRAADHQPPRRFTLRETLRRRSQMLEQCLEQLLRDIDRLVQRLLILLDGRHNSVHSAIIHTSQPARRILRSS